MSLQLQVVKSAMTALAKGTATGPLQNLGLLPQELELVTGNIPWKASERNQVSKALHTLMYSTQDALGLQRFEVPAEYVAATIAMFVSPTNIMVACSWMEADLLSASAIGNPHLESINRNEIRAAQLFALVLQMLQDCETIDTCKAQFEARVNMSIDKPRMEAANNAISKLSQREEKRRKTES